MVTYGEVSNSEEVKAYIRQADASLISMGFTEHSFAHVVRTATVTQNILTDLGYDTRTIELAKIAAFMHDIGNVINRIDHAQSGAVMAFRILDKMGMDPVEVAQVVSAIGNHDEHTAHPVNALAAALILADKSDVRRSRVRNRDIASFDIHDRVNYSVEQSSLKIDKQARTITLVLTIDSKVSTLADYFEIFLERMLLCRKAAKFFDFHFHLCINGVAMM
ncbi:HD domain-containing protein [Oscillospiraceae bacterium LTW-04]|nr:HD domain-containing protein [Oscillospiraceae bacterium MB24-C1]